MTKKKHSHDKPKRKVKLPCDRTGAPIGVGDIIEWDGGQRMKVATLTYYGKSSKGFDSWTAEDDYEEFTDNLGMSLVVRRGDGR